MKILLTILLSQLAFAASLPTAKPQDAGMSAERLARIHSALQRYVDRDEIAGAVSLGRTAWPRGLSRYCRHDRSRSRKADETRRHLPHRIDDHADHEPGSDELMTSNHIGNLPLWKSLAGYRFG